MNFIKKIPSDFIIDDYLILLVNNTNLKIIFLYLTIFFTIFLTSYLVIDKINKKINVLILVLLLLALILIRSITLEPYLYQSFYDQLPLFRSLVNLILYYNLKIIIDSVLLLIVAGATIFLLRYYALSLLAIVAVIIIIYNFPLNLGTKQNNAQTILVVMADSLRKDIIKDNPNLFLHQIYNDSMVLERMYTTAPASVPTMAGILSNNYPYKARATAIFLDKQLDLSYIEKLKQDYLISLHTDFTDDEIINRSNFNVTFDYVNVPYIDNLTQATARIIKKNVALLSFIGGSFRSLILPEYYQGDNKGSDKKYIDSALNFIKENRDKKKIVFLSLSAAHVPFEANYPYYRPYLKESPGDEFKWSFGYVSYNYDGSNPSDNQNIRNLYLMNTVQLDDQIKYLFERLNRTKLMDNATIIITADHGENIFDNDLYLFSHNNIDTRHVLQVPFIIYRQDKTGSADNENNFALTDTINIAMNPENADAYAQDYIYIESDFDLKNNNSNLYAGDPSKIYYVQNNRDMSIVNYDLWHQSKKRALIYKNYQLSYKPEEEKKYYLYNIDNDPLYQTDIKKQNPEIYSLMRIKLNEFIQDTLNYLPTSSTQYAPGS